MTKPNPFKPPIYIKHQDILLLQFLHTSHLSQAMGNVHLYYEGGKLKGPLKGINFPIHVYMEWKSSLNSVNGMTQVESLIDEMITKADPVYIIACLYKDQSSIYHEWVHAQYFLHPHIRELAEKMYSELPSNTLKIIQCELKMRGYQPQVYIDEFIAYLIESPFDFGKKSGPLLKPLHDQLRKLIPRPILPDVVKETFEP